MKHDRSVALKVLRQDVSGTLGAERFLREIHVSARLHHPNILPLLDSGESDGALYYVMPLVTGESLRERITREKQLPLEAAVAITTQVAAALGYAHRQGVIHRDIKPENILLQEGTALVADFGIALALHADGRGRMTQPGITLGTPHYMSPEQAAGDADLDERSDVFSLGCVLYEMLTGEPPHHGRSPRATIAKLLMDAPPSARRLRRTVTTAMDAALRRALATSRSDRIASTQEFVALLANDGDPTPAWHSVAVLPLANLSADPENEYFADGMTEDIIAQLSKIGSLKVISRTSVMQFKHRRTSLADIAHALGVTAVIDGSVRRAGARVRIVVQLIDAATDAHIWSETYDRDLVDIFAIQSDVALSVAKALRAVITSSERQQIDTRPTDNIEAHDLYLLGRHHWFLFTPDGAHKAEEYFRKALAVDPDYAPAYAGLSNYYLIIGGAPLNILPSSQTVAEARRMAERAIALDATLGEAHGSLGLIQAWFEWNWAAAAETVRRGTERAPNNSSAWSASANVHTVLGLHAEAIRDVERALQLDPLNALMLQVAGIVHCYARRYDAAQRYADRVRELHPGFAMARVLQALLFLAQGKDREALSVVDLDDDIWNGADYHAAIAATALGRSGDTGGALQIASRLEEQCRAGMAAWSNAALAHLGAGDVDRALHLLELVPEQRPAGSFSTSFLGVDPLFDAVRENGRFTRVLQRLGIHHRRGELG